LKRWIGGGLAVVVVAIAVFAIAQGGGGDGGPLNAIAKAAEVTQREPGGRAVIHATIKSSTTPEGITENGSMTFDESGRARGVLTMKGMTNGKELEFEVVADSTTSYTTSDSLDSLPEGKKWIELDLAAAAGKSATSVPASGGPEEGLRVLENVEGAKAVGKEDIDGVPTTHYEGKLPTSEEVFGVKAHYSALDVDVWIDAQERVRRMQMVVSGSVGESDSSTTEMTIDYVSFGRVPKIALPNPDEVFNATDELESKVQESAAGN
jgi:hypothetical protein